MAQRQRMTSPQAFGYGVARTRVAASARRLSAPKRATAAPILCRRVVPLIAAALLAAACGHRMDTDSLRAANGGVAANSAESSPAESLGSQQAPAGTTSGIGGTAAASTGGDVATSVPAAGAPSEVVDPAPDDTGVTDVCSTSETGPIGIGSVGNYSGPAGAALLPIVRGLQLWAAWANSQGGVCGREVQIMVVDDHSDPAQYRAALQDLVENRHVVSFSNVAPLTGDAGVSYIESVGVPVIGNAVATPREYASPMYFSGGIRASQLAYAAARAAALYGPPSRRYGYITCVETPACSSEIDDEMNGPDGAAATAGVDVVYRGQVSSVQPDYTSECQGASAAGAEVISFFLDPESIRRFARSCERQGYRPVHSVVSGSIQPHYAAEPGFTTIIMVTPVFPFTADVTPAQQEFHAAIADLYGGPAGPSEAQGWTHGKIFERAAIVAAQTTGTISSSSLIDALHTFRDETFGGLTVPITFPAGSAGVVAPCWFVVQATNGTWATLNDGAPVCRT